MILVEGSINPSKMSMQEFVVTITSAVPKLNKIKIFSKHFLEFCFIS